MFAIFIDVNHSVASSVLDSNTTGFTSTFGYCFLKASHIAWLSEFLNELIPTVTVPLISVLTSMLSELPELPLPLFPHPVNAANTIEVANNILIKRFIVLPPFYLDCFILVVLQRLKNHILSHHLIGLFQILSTVC